jgi:hypothetical protein
MSEQWRPIPTYEGLYEVSDRGRVRRVLGGTGTRILKPWRQWQGYLTVRLSRDGYKKLHFIHRLVVWAFDDSIPSDMEVNHKNGRKDDNRWPENLERVTRSYNQYHCNHVIQTRTPQSGSKHGCAKLTEELVLQIRARADEGCKALAEAFGVSMPTVSMILSRKTWRHI